MTKKLLTKTCALMLLAVFAAAWSITASAGIRIYVRTEGSAAGTAPYLYVWDNDDQPLNGAWSSCQMSETTTTSDGQTWYVKEFNETSVNAIIHNNLGGDNNKTPDLTGIQEDRYYSYKGGSEYYNLTNQYVIPENATYQEGNFVYFVNTSEWETPCIWVYDNNDVNYNTNSNWPGDQLTKVANSVNLWAWKGTKSGNPTKIIFSNNGGSETAALEYYNGGYYHTGALITTITQLQLNSTNFPDANFRAALADALNVNEGDNIYPNNVKILDVSGKSISNLTGIENFTNLEELYAGNNDLTHLVLTSNSKLQILDIKNNNQIIGFSTSTATASNHFINLSPSSNKAPLKKFDATGCPIFGYFRAIHDTYGISSLEWLSLNGCEAMDGWSSGITAQTNLKYLDLTNSGQKTSELTAANLNFPSLETLILANNTSVTTPVLTNLTSLKTLDVKNCAISSLDITHNTSLEYLYASGNATDPAMTIPNTNSLKWIDMSDGNLSYITAFNKLSNLQHLDLHNCPHLSAAQFNSSRINSTANPNLQYLNISQSGNSASSKITTFTDDWAYIDTLIVQGGNSPVEKVIVNNHMPNVLDVTNNTTLTTLAINNCGLTSLPTITATGATSLYKLDLSDNAFEDVPTTGISSLTTLVMNNNQLEDINVSESNIQYLYAQNNNFGSGAYTLPTTSLVGLDLGNNGFTKFKTENNTSLKSLALAGNTNLTEIELHGNTALTQTSPDGVIESNNGLYIKGLSNLQTLNIENSSFSKLGQQNSLQGVTGLKTLKARHNEFTTFTNGVYNLDIAGNANYRVADPNESSLEYLTNLEYLDLAYNNLQDSVHLYRNVALKHLDVSHNNEIHGVYDGTITTDAQKLAMLERKGRHLMKYGRVKFNGTKKPYGVNATDAQWTTHYTNLQASRQSPFDLRECDLNDTTGLYHLDLGKNVNLEYIDFSYTNIHNTAAGPTYMCPGWMDKDWVTDIDALSAQNSSNTTTHRAFMSWHTFIYFIPCSKLKVIHADHNNLSGFGVRYFPDLDTLTCSYMYGESAMMRDYPTNNDYSDLRYGKGNTGTQTKIKKFKSVTWGTNDEDETTGTVVLVGPNGSTDNNSDFYPNKLRYFDISYSSFNEIRFYPGAADNGSLPELEYIDVSGNPLNCQVHPNSTVSNYNSLDVTYCPNIRTVKAENCSDLPTVRAHNRTKLDTLYLSNDPKLKTLYIQNDPLLKTNFEGLNTLTGLETLFAYNNTQWGGIDVANNTALKNLWISNIGTSSINVANNANLEKLRAYDNSLTALDLSNNGELLWLDVARNKLPEIDLSGNTKLQFFNISNGSDTRTQLDGTEALNHDGSDGDAIKPTTIFSADEAPIANANNGNSLSDLALPASITDARANGNDLHSITGNFANLTNIEFAHNHVNGINLSAAPNATVDSRDNGRTIVADFATFKAKDNNNVVQEYKLYFFQLENPDEPNGTILTDKESKDLKLASRHLGDDGLALDKIGGWDSDNSGVLKSGTTVTPSNMGTILDPSQIPGNIVVLVPEDVNEATNEASGRSTYTYTTGASSVENQGGSKFYLDWTSNGTVTGINIVDMPLDEVTITNTQGNLTVNGADGTVVGVYDLNGRQVASETISDGKAVITDLAPGIYVVNGQKVLVK